MTLPQNVKDAVKFANAECGKSSDFTFDMSGADWQTIRAHLLSQEAEIERYKVAWTEYNDRTEWVQKTAKPKELGLHRADVLRLRIESAESRLAVANALLRDIKDWDVNQAQGAYLMVPLNLRKRIQAHLSENADVQP